MIKALANALANERYEFSMGGRTRIYSIVFLYALIFYSESYSQTRIFVRDSTEIKSEFGDVKYSFLYVANIKNTHAKFLVYLIGEKKHGSIALRADQKNDHWIVRREE